MEIKVGISKTANKTVTDNDSAIKVGSGLVDVFATPSMVAFIEKTCSEALIPYLDDGFVTVGSNINANHVKPSKIGANVICNARVIEVINNKIIRFEFEVIDGDQKVGYGQHTRVVVNKQKFIDKLNNKI